MSYTFQDVSLKVKQEKDNSDKLQIAAEIIATYCEKVYKAFEKETGLKADDHYSDIVNTHYFNNYFRFVNKTSATIYYIIRKKSFFKNAIILEGNLFFNKDGKTLHVYIANSSVDPFPYLKQLVDQISSESALLK